MTDRELWERIKGKPWAWPGLAFHNQHGVWTLDEVVIGKANALALIRVGCEDWLGENATLWSRTQGNSPITEPSTFVWWQPDRSKDGDSFYTESDSLGVLIDACEWLVAQKGSTP